MKRFVSIISSLCFLFGTFLFIPTSVLATELDSDFGEAEANDTYQEEAPHDTEWEDATPAYRAFTSSAATFSQEEMEGPDLWYAVPDRVVTLSATPAGTAYTRLLSEIQSAPTNTITHIILPFHINIGNISSGTATIVGIRNGATVVLIGDHPTAENGQSVISDTHGNGSVVPRSFRLRGDGSARSGLVLRNIVLQTAVQAPQGIPDTVPTPLLPEQQTGNARGGGVAIETGSVSGITGTGGGGHLILCRGSVIRNSSTDNNGTVDIQTDGRFTMMPGSEMHTNVAGNSGGAVHVSTRAIFNMHGGVIRDNVARGERADAAQAMWRAVGGAVFVRNGGTFNMFDGEIYNNTASLGELAGNPSATNAIVTSSGGGVFVTGTGSTFHMHGGAIRNNHAIRTRASNVSSATSTSAGNDRSAFRAGNGGGVFLNNGAAFHMHGGDIEANTATASGTVTGNDALNLSNGGGVYLSDANTSFVMHGGTIRNNQAVRTLNSIPRLTRATMFIFAGTGGGVHVYNSEFTMHGGEISGNLATATGTIAEHQAGDSLSFLANGGGVFVSGIGSTDAREVTRFYMNGGKISDNHVIGTVANTTSIAGNGGGVSSINRAQFHMTNGLIEKNTATDTAPTPIVHGSRRGNGAGVYLVSFGTEFVFDMSGGEIREHTTVSRHGVGVYLTAGQMELRGTARIADNHSPNNGGGIFVEENGILNISGGTISGNTAAQFGGGVFLTGTNARVEMREDIPGLVPLIEKNRADIGGAVALENGAGFTMRAGQIENNRATIDGGGVHVAEGSSFYGAGGTINRNIANDGGGLFVPHSNLSNVSIAHAFVFSDNTARNGLRIDNALAAAQRIQINPGTVSISEAVIVDEVPIGSGDFAEVMSHAFTNYDINSTGPPFWRVTYGLGSGDGQIDATVGANRFPLASNSLLPTGTEVTFAAEAAPTQQFDGWNIGTREHEVTEDGGAVPFHFNSGGAIAPLSHSVRMHTHMIGNFKKFVLTTLSISKTVEGDFGNRNQDFEFTIHFQDTDGKSLPAGAQFSYVGDILSDSGATAPPDGILTLDHAGAATFKLRHGQIIVIEGVQSGSYVQIIELPDMHYLTSFVDSDAADVTVSGNDTSILPMTENRVFHFINSRVVVPDTGIRSGHIGTVLLLPMLGLLCGLQATVIGAVYRYRKRVC